MHYSRKIDNGEMLYDLTGRISGRQGMGSLLAQSLALNHQTLMWPRFVAID